MRDIALDTQFPVDPQMQQIFDAARTSCRQSDFRGSPEIGIFLSLAAHPSVRPVLTGMGFGGNTIALIVDKVWAPPEIATPTENPGVVEAPEMAMRSAVMGAFVESVAGGRMAISPRDMTIALLSQRPKPLDLVIDKLEIALGFDTQQTIEKIRTTPQSVADTPSKRI